MKIDRLIGIITILLQQDKITAPELAERFEVSRRTINRDIEDICKAGIPLITTQGYGGGISIDDRYKIDRSFFTDEELQTIFTGLKGIDSVSKTSYLKTLLEKLSDKENRMISEDIIILDLASHYQKPLTKKIELIKYAIRERRILSFHYYYSKGEQQKRIEPYHLIFKWSSWYVFGYCPDRQGYRLFKLNRLWELQVMEETYSVRTIPEKELKLDDYFTSGSIHLKALFAPSEKYRLIEEYGIECFSSTESGELLLERDFVNYENMREWIFSFGDKVRIMEPGQLKTDRKNQAERILQMD
ncbi:helix-turn-helix transcriptional regulator [Qiania dongpingensis]|uniref:YafY family transcriptional regulator n=1 Tax=Qiania dongpingensis TaxID=2763669 RepID=A0A7G9G539_9FIRM|nr:YafY family protein [Qiania dongpingensis]QNM05921.1 YafY family transcriptional regulator [Qiania dongpingensis]